MLWLTKHRQRALVEAVSCWGDGGAAVVTNGRLSEAWRSYGDGGGGEELGCCCGEEMKMVSTGGSRRVRGAKAALWLITAALGRTPTTRGQFLRHAAASA